MQQETAIFQLKTMLEMQHAMNLKVHEKWIAQAYPWYRAIWVECAEMLDHHGWKWWKHQTPDLEQVSLELVDIFHFGLSSYFDESLDFDAYARKLAPYFLDEPAESERDFPALIEDLAQFALANKAFDMPTFRHCLEKLNLSLDDLYRQYIGKNTLNLFRQDKGYKTGSYQKTWHGKEDNEHLSEILRETDAEAANFSDLVYSALSDRYSTL